MAFERGVPLGSGPKPVLACNVLSRMRNLGRVGRDLRWDHVTRAHWTRSRYHVKVKILTVFRPGSGLLEAEALYRSGTVAQPS